MGKYLEDLIRSGLGVAIENVPIIGNLYRVLDDFYTNRRISNLENKQSELHNLLTNIENKDPRSSFNQVYNYQKNNDLVLLPDLFYNDPKFKDFWLNYKNYGGFEEPLSKATPKKDCISFLMNDMKGNKTVFHMPYSVFYKFLQENRFQKSKNKISQFDPQSKTNWVKTDSGLSVPEHVITTKLYKNQGFNLSKFILHFSPILASGFVGANLDKIGLYLWSKVEEINEFLRKGTWDLYQTGKKHSNLELGLPFSWAYIAGAYISRGGKNLFEKLSVSAFTTAVPVYCMLKYVTKAREAGKIALYAAGFSAIIASITALYDKMFSKTKYNNKKAPPPENQASSITRLSVKSSFTKTLFGAAAAGALGAYLKNQDLNFLQNALKEYSSIATGILFAGSYCFASCVSNLRSFLSNIEVLSPNAKNQIPISYSIPANLFLSGVGGMIFGSIPFALFPSVNPYKATLNLIVLNSLMLGMHSIYHSFSSKRTLKINLMNMIYKNALFDQKNN